MKNAISIPRIKNLASTHFAQSGFLDVYKCLITKESMIVISEYKRLYAYIRTYFNVLTKY